MLADTRPLRIPAFRRLWGAQIVNVVGAQLTVVSVPAQIYAITHSSAFVGLSGVFGLVPIVVFGLWGGAVADAFDRRTVLIGTTLGLIASSAGFWIQAALGNRNVWLLLGLFSVQQVFFALNSPVTQAAIPRIVPAGLLPAANSLTMTVGQGGAIAGPLLGGALIPVLGFSWLYLLDALSTLATLYAVVRLPRLPIDNPAGTPGLRSVVDGLRYLSRHKVLMMSFVVDIIAMVFGMPRALFPQIAHESFAGPIEGGVGFALLFAAIPAGALVGGVLSGWVSRVRRQGFAVVLAITVWGAAMVLFGAAAALGERGPGFLWLAVLALVIGGAADIASAAFRTAMLQSAAADEMRGRLQGVFIVVVAGGPRISDVLHGSVAAAIGPALTAISGGVLVVLGMLVVSVMVPTFVRYRVTN